jgi:DNA-binding NarL/FixJ family response regulator
MIPPFHIASALAVSDIVRGLTGLPLNEQTGSLFSNEDLEHVISALSTQRPLQLNNSLGTPLLTRREEDEVRLVADGLRNREIALRLQG